MTIRNSFEKIDQIRKIKGKAAFKKKPAFSFVKQIFEPIKKLQLNTLTVGSRIFHFFLDGIIFYVKKTTFFKIYHDIQSWIGDTRILQANLYYIIFSSIFINLFSLAFPLTMLQVYDRIIPTKGQGTLISIIIITICALVFEIIMKIARSYLSGNIGVIFEHNLSVRGLTNLLKNTMFEKEGKEKGDYIKQMTNITKLKMFYSGQTFISIIDIPFVFLFLYVIYFISGPLFLVPLVLLLVFIILARSLTLKIKGEIKERNDYQEFTYNRILHILDGIHLVKSSGSELIFIRRKEKMQEKISKMHFSISLKNFITANLGGLLAQVNTILLVFFGALLIKDSKIGMGTLVATVILSGKVMGPVQKILNFWSKLQELSIIHQSLKDLFKEKNLDEKKFDFVSSISHGHLHVENVSIKFSEEEVETTPRKNFFEGISLVVNPGETVSISGPPGSGKSSLLNLLGGIHDPEEGNILLDGYNLKRIPKEILFRNIGFLPENPNLFNGSIRDNLTLFGTIPFEDLIGPMEDFGLDTSINHLPRGLDTILTNSISDTVSLGIKKRIALARVFATKPKLILYDNAESGLDKIGYNLFFENLGKLTNTSLVIVSEDQNFLGLAQRKYKLENGRLNLYQREELIPLKNF